MDVLAFEWAAIWEYREDLLEGLVETLKVAAIGVVGAFLVGLVLGAARAHRVPIVSQLAAAYVEVIRNTPILVQIFFVFFALPQFHIRFEPETAC
ncbi:MAG: ABC transporter permease subunit, partial [Actinobacteria bacterium]|nr:ABC transporter permease subunit [Actinomycetota bacterium]